MTVKVEAIKTYIALEEIPPLLLELYEIETKIKLGKGSYENYYDGLISFIEQTLNAYQKNNFVWWRDDIGNMYIEPKNSTRKHIVLSAHMDKVHTNGAVSKLYYDINSGQLFAHNKDKKQTSLGADDKNGIFVILDMYKNLKAEDLPSIVFTVDEESGCIGSNAIDKTFFEDKEFCVVVDRRNSKDLIYKGGSKLYGITLPMIFHKLNPEYKYTVGATSDANCFSEFIECMNVSCGYYKPHGSTEYTVVDELLETRDAVMKFILNYDIKLEKSDIISFMKELSPSSSYTSTTSYSKNTYWNKYEDYYYDTYADYYDKSYQKSWGYTEICPWCGEKSYNSKDKECWYCGAITEAEEKLSKNLKECDSNEKK